ncbi:EF-hand domain-containing protein [Actinomadura algeriensis]|uniref:Ca2+-binding EF-hand superfamily protein n=1 Tax=Actinomadura algeriensis TaxID=1679523 RepID=A0ABR9K0C8_9ACTN|nr:EF-hand domain-containing protein [Actinomadura algeriensis]MBE1536284.1 Ca2+-binding EF-hand superfamily protein [Actinomadura algeriensis]
MSSIDEYKPTFDLVDVDGDGYISIPELQNLMRALGLGVDQTRAVELVVESDTNRDGKISLEEFAALMERTRS